MSRWLSALAFGLPVLTTALFLPLALRMVGPNSIYGYRTARSLSSPEAWYAANATAGWCGVAFSILSLILTFLIVRTEIAGGRNRYLVSIQLFVGLMLASALVQYGLNG